MIELLQNQVLATHVVAAAGAVTVGTLFTHPIDTVKILTQVASREGRRLTISTILACILTTSGYSGLYSGINLSILGRISSIATRFGVYEILIAYCKDGRETGDVYISEAFWAGVASGAMESLTSSPFEIAKLRAQVASALHSRKYSSVLEERNLPRVIAKLLPGYISDRKVLNSSACLLSILSTKHPDMARALEGYPWTMTGSGRPPPVYKVMRMSDIVRFEGWSSLWRGLRSGIARDSLFGGLYFGLWEFFHQGILNWKAVGMDPIPSSNDEVGPLDPVVVSITSGISASIAALASHHFDTAKARSQCIVTPKYVTMERKMFKWREVGSTYERLTGIHPADRDLLSNGRLLRASRTGIAAFLITATYFYTIDQFLPKSS